MRPGSHFARGRSQDDRGPNDAWDFRHFIERGERNVGLLNVTALAEALDAHPSELLADL